MTTESLRKSIGQRIKEEFGEYECCSSRDSETSQEREKEIVLPRVRTSSREMDAHASLQIRNNEIDTSTYRKPSRDAATMRRAPTISSHDNGWEKALAALIDRLRRMRSDACAPIATSSALSKTTSDQMWSTAEGSLMWALNHDDVHGLLQAEALYLQALQFGLPSDTDTNAIFVDDTEVLLRTGSSYHYVF